MAGFIRYTGSIFPSFFALLAVFSVVCCNYAFVDPCCSELFELVSFYPFMQSETSIFWYPCGLAQHQFSYMILKLHGLIVTHHLYVCSHLFSFYCHFTTFALRQWLSPFIFLTHIAPLEFPAHLVSVVHMFLVLLFIRPVTACFSCKVLFWLSFWQYFDFVPRYMQYCSLAFRGNMSF